MYLVGYVLKPHGVRGELKIDPVTPDPVRFKKLEKVFLEENDFQAYSIERVRLSGRFVYLKLAGIDDRDTADKLRGHELFIEQKDLIDLPANSFFVHDIIGCEVIDISGDRIGRVRDVLDVSASDIYRVVSDDGKEFLIPAVKEIVKFVDVENKIIRIDPPDGLIE